MTRAGEGELCEERQGRDLRGRFPDRGEKKFIAVNRTRRREGPGAEDPRQQGKDGALAEK